MTDDLISLYAYDRWAEARLIEACRQVPPERYGEEVIPGWTSLRSTVAHILGASELWYRRFTGASTTGFIPESDLTTIEAALALSTATHDGYDALLKSLSPAQLSAPFTWTNLKGAVNTAPLWSVFRHVANHATYHRGQASSKLGRLGVEVPVTDLVYWAAEVFQARG